MTTKELERDKNLKVIEYTFDEEEIKRIEDEVARYLNQRTEIPGFRKGRVPKHILKVRLGDVFNEYILDFLTDKVSESVEREHLIALPVVRERRLSEGSARIVVELHEEPAVKLGDLSKIEVQKVNEDKVLERYVEKRLEDLRERHALLEPKEGPAEMGDLVRVKVDISNEEGKVLTSREYEYVLKEGEDRPFVKDLLGKRKGDAVEVEREFEGKKYKYIMEVKEVYRRSLLEISDELAKAVGNEFETLEQLKEALREEGKNIYDVEMKANMREQLSEKLPDFVEMEISDRTLSLLVEEAIERMKREGKYDQLLERYGDEKKIREDLERAIVRDIKFERAVEEFAKEKGITVTEEELEKEAEEIAPFWGVSAERAKSIVRSRRDVREDLEWAVLKRKVLDAMLELVTVKIVEPAEGGGADEEGEKVEGNA